MNQLQQELFEKQLRSLVKGFEYPRPPDVAGGVVRRLRGFTSPMGRGGRGEGLPHFVSRRFAWSLAVILVLLASLMLIPPARAAIVEFIQIGVVRIFRAEPTQVSPPPQESPSTIVPLTATPGPTSKPLIPILEEFAGEMTLDEAQKTVGYPILRPS